MTVLSAGCQPARHPIPAGRDSGQAVVVVDAPKKSALPPVPLIDEKEPNDDLSHAQPIEWGKGIRGSIGVPHTVRGKPRSDDDYFSWVQPAGVGEPAGAFQLARVTLSGIPNTDLSFEVLDGDGKRLWLASDAGVGEGERMVNLAVDPGHTYYLHVRSATPQPVPGSYELVLETVPAPPGSEREPNDDAGHATPLAGFGDVTGYFGRRRDEDFYLFPGGLPKGSLLKLELSPVDGVTAAVRVVSGATLVAESRGGRGDELRLRNVGVPSGPFAISVKAVEGRNLDVPYTLKLGSEADFEGAEREPNDTPDRATPLALTSGQSQVSGFLWPGDVDFYRVTGAPQDSFVRAELDGVDRVDLRIERLAPSGRVMVRADDQGTGKGEKLPPWPGGEVFLRVSARPHDSTFEMPYRLQVSTSPAEADLEREPNHLPPLATPWTMGAAQMRGYMAPRGDEDLFRFSVPAGKNRVLAEVTDPSGMEIDIRITDEGRLPLAPVAVGKLSAPVVGERVYLLSLKAHSDKAANPDQAYTVTLRFE